MKKAPVRAFFTAALRTAPLRKPALLTLSVRLPRKSRPNPTSPGLPARSPCGPGVRPTPARGGSRGLRGRVGGTVPGLRWAWEEGAWGRSVLPQGVPRRKKCQRGQGRHLWDDTFFPTLQGSVRVGFVGLLGRGRSGSGEGREAKTLVLPGKRRLTHPSAGAQHADPR